MAELKPLKKGDRVIWQQENGSGFLATIVEAASPDIKIELDDYAKPLAEGEQKKLHQVEPNDLNHLTDEQDLQSNIIAQAASFIPLASKICEQRGCALSGAQLLSLYYALSHKVIQETLKDS
jgi:hypothetical protein